jgi:hypothetical protein
MSGTVFAISALAAAMIAMGTPAAAQVLDAVYRGTLVCDKLPFTATKMREAIHVAIAGGAVRYTHVVRLRDTAEAVPEHGTGTLSGQRISLQGTWSGDTSDKSNTNDKRKYQANYSGTFVRRSAKLTGTQTWTDGGKTVTRACSGAIKRPLKAFLPRTSR